MPFEKLVKKKSYRDPDPRVCFRVTHYGGMRFPLCEFRFYDVGINRGDSITFEVGKLGDKGSVRLSKVEENSGVPERMIWRVQGRKDCRPYVRVSAKTFGILNESSKLVECKHLAEAPGVIVVVMPGWVEWEEQP